MKRNIVAVALVAQFAVGAPAFSQGTVAQPSSQLLLSLVKFEESAGKDDLISTESVSRTLTSVNEYVRWLQRQSFDETEVRQIGDIISLYVEAVGRVRATADDEKSKALFEAIRLDFDRRNDAVRKQLGATTKSPFVSISVRTKIAGQQQERVSVSVGYSLEGLPFADKRYRRMIPSLTPVTLFRILPGSYLFFAELDGVVIGQKLAEVGFTGIALEAVEIPVP